MNRTANRLETFSSFSRILSFMGIGTLAAAIQISVVIFLVERVTMLPMLANLIGFVLAFQVSYWGQRTFSFRGAAARHSSALPKWLLLQGMNMVLNEVIFGILLSMNMPYVIALVMTLGLLSVTTYLIAQKFIF